MSRRLLVAGLTACSLASGGWGWQAVAESLADRAARDGVIINPRNDPEMARAFARARGDLAGFLALAAAPRRGTRGFAVKVGFATSAGGMEYVWLAPFERRAAGFIGQVSSVPVYVPNLRAGQLVPFTDAEVVDWMYFDANGRMVGNRTACVELAHESPASAREFEARYGLSCAVR